MTQLITATATGRLESTAPTFSTKQSRRDFYMSGTEGTGLFIVPIKADGRVGYRVIDGGTRIRVRVEPARNGASRLNSTFPSGTWKQPSDGGQNRYSLVIPNSQVELEKVLATVVAALVEKGGSVKINKETPAFARDLAERVVLVGVAKSLKVPGSNAASRWTLDTLRRKIAAF